MFAAVGFESPLAAGSGELDIQLGSPRTERQATYRSVARARDDGALSPAWERVYGVCREWVTPGTLLDAHLAELWCELDAGSTTGATGLADLVPSVFAVISPAAGTAGPAVAVRTLEHLVDRDRRAGPHAALERCVSACRGGARVSHVGVMLGRPVCAVRLHISDLPLAAISSYLIDAGWPGDVERAQDIARLLLDHGDIVVLCLDVVDRLLPRLGIECFFEQKVGIDPRWRPLLDRLVDTGLGAPEKCAALLRWPGVITPAVGGSHWPDTFVVRSLTQPADRLGVVERRLSHVKLAFGCDGHVSAKAYFGAGHVWWRATPADTPPHQRRTLLAASSVHDAVDAGTGYLLAARNQGGWWRDFFDRGRPADVASRVAGYASDEWVSAYVGWVMATTDRVPARTAAREVLESLLMRRGDAGWGYHALLPPDADTTTWVLRLAAAVDAPENGRIRRARDFVADLVGPSGGVATYPSHAAKQLEAFLRMPGPYDGWSAPHTCVTAAAAVLALDARPLAFLAAAQRADGSWTGHWWDDDEYTTLRAVESLSGTGAHERAVARAVRWAGGRIGDDGSVRAACDRTPSPFATSLAVHTVLAGRSAARASHPSAAVSRAVGWLLSQQRDDGSWAPSARLRVPAPDQRDPLAAPAATLSYLDNEALFTTATVLAALGQLPRA